LLSICRSFPEIGGEPLQVRESARAEVVGYRLDEVAYALAALRHAVEQRLEVGAGGIVHVFVEVVTLRRCHAEVLGAALGGVARAEEVVERGHGTARRLVAAELLRDGLDFPRR
jgi:hypothetical protein